MSSMRKWQEEDASELERYLLEAGADDEPPPAVQRRVLQRLGLAAGLSAAATSIVHAAAASQSAAPIAGTAGIGAGASAAAGTTSALAGAGVSVVTKWVAIGLVAGTATSTGAVVLSQSQSESQRSPASAVSASPTQRAAIAPAMRHRRSAPVAPAPARAEPEQDPIQIVDVEELVPEPVPQPALAPASSPSRKPRQPRTTPTAEAPRAATPLSEESPAAVSNITAADGSEEAAAADAEALAEPHVNFGVLEEIAALDRARSAIARGAPRRALQVLAERARRFGTGTLEPEAQLLQAEALLLAGRAADARLLARRFLHVHANSPHASRMRNLLDRAERGPASR